MNSAHSKVGLTASTAERFIFSDHTVGIMANSCGQEFWGLPAEAALHYRAKPERMTRRYTSVGLWVLLPAPQHLKRKSAVVGIIRARLKNGDPCTPAEAVNAFNSDLHAAWKQVLPDALPTLSREEAEARIEELSGTEHEELRK